MLTARVAQSVERSAVNRKVGGSNPPVSDIFSRSIYRSLLLFGVGLFGQEEGEELF